MRELLRPPAHRGPLIATGAVVLGVGLALEQIRLSPGDGWQFAAVAAYASAVLWLALQARPEGGRPPGWQSVMIVLGLLALYVALLRLSRLLGADLDGTEVPSGALAWTGVVQAAAAAAVSARRNSAFAALIAAVATTIAVLAAWDLVFSPGSVTPYRWLLLALALGFALASLPLRSVSLRHADQMVNAAGASIAALALLDPIATSPFGIALKPLQGFWEVVLLAGGFGLVAYAAADRAPGPAYLGALVLVEFVVFSGVGGESTLLGWPITLLIVGLAIMAIGLRPRAPLPPEPDGYRQGELPLAARTDEEVVVRVRQD